MRTREWATEGEPAATGERRPDLAADPRQGLFLVLRVLFDAEPHPPPRLGGSRPAAPASAAALPRFPIMIVGDCW